MDDIFTVNLPDIGEGVVEGEVVEWLKKPGDSLEQDEPVVVVMTDKATVELPAPYPGKLSKQYFQAGQIAHKGKPLYDIQLEGPAAKQISARSPVHPCPAKESRPEPVMQRESLKETVSSSEKVLAAPPVRKLARELNLNINQIKGTGPEGRVTAQDLQGQTKIKNAPILRLPEDEERAVTGIRNLMASRMAESHANIPQFSYFEQTDVTRLIQLRDNLKAKAAEEQISLTYMPFFIRALALTIQKHPELNSSFDANAHKLYMHKQVNVGIAFATSYGLIVPVLKNVEKMSLNELVHSYDQLKKRAQENKLSPSDMKEATITISNYGVLGGGGLWATPIVNYPEVAILAVAKIQKQPVVKEEALVIRDVLNLSWSFDHRVIDGELAAKSSHDFSLLVQNPATLV